MVTDNWCVGGIAKLSQHWKVTSNGYVKVQRLLSKEKRLGFPGGAAVENLPANAGDTGSSPGLGRSHMPRSN